MAILTEGQRLPNSIPLSVEQNWAQNLETNCQWAKHRKEQITTIGLIIVWPEKLQIDTAIAELPFIFT